MAWVSQLAILNNTFKFITVFSINSIVSNDLLCSWVLSLLSSYFIAIHQVANLENHKLYGLII